MKGKTVSVEREKVGERLLQYRDGLTGKFRNRCQSLLNLLPVSFSLFIDVVVFQRIRALCFKRPVSAFLSFKRSIIPFKRRR